MITTQSSVENTEDNSIESPLHPVTRFIRHPRYGFVRNGDLYIPKSEELWNEFFSRVNVFKDRKNWLAAFSIFSSVLLAVPFVLFVTSYFTWPLLLVAALYSYFVLNIHTTIYMHRYAAHKAFTFRNMFATFLFKNLVIKIIHEEIFVVSHYVHHVIPEKPGDPYNALCGWLYCFIAEVNHQPIARDLSRKDYELICKMLDHVAVPLNSYANYLKTGSCTKLSWAVFEYAFNWILWFSLLTFIGGVGLACAVFSGAFFWAISIRNFNFKSHGSGIDKRRDGIEFNRDDLSMNLKLAGIAAGEWHNNHHLFPRSARNGFLPGQIDFAFDGIKFLYNLGLVTHYNDDIEKFYQKTKGITVH